MKTSAKYFGLAARP